MDLRKLAEPFKAEDIEWRIQQTGGFDKKPWALVLAYVTNRAVMERLDDVCGVAGWGNEFKESPDGGVLCGITIHIGDGATLTKWDGAENTSVEPVKGGLSGAMKRAAVQWGIGRYLYNLESNFVNLQDHKIEGYNRHYEKDQRKSFYWKTPVLPEWALPKEKND